MKFESRVAVISFLCGLLVVVTLSTGDYYLLERPFISGMFERAVILIVFTVFGIVLQRVLLKKSAAERKLKKQMNEIKKLNEIMEQREHRIVEMKDEVNSLLGEMGREAKYNV